MNASKSAQLAARKGPHFNKLVASKALGNMETATAMKAAAPTAKASTTTKAISVGDRVFVPKGTFVKVYRHNQVIKTKATARDKTAKVKKVDGDNIAWEGHSGYTYAAMADVTLVTETSAAA